MDTCSHSVLHFNRFPVLKMNLFDDIVVTFWDSVLFPFGKSTSYTGDDVSEMCKIVIMRKIEYMVEWCLCLSFAYVICSLHTLSYIGRVCDSHNHNTCNKTKITK